MEKLTCDECGTRFNCGAPPGKDHCWCMELPNMRQSFDLAGKCVCPDCTLCMFVVLRLLRNTCLRRHSSFSSSNYVVECPVLHTKDELNDELGIFE